MRKCLLQIAQFPIERDILCPAYHMNQPSLAVEIPYPAVRDLTDPVRASKCKHRPAPCLQVSPHPVQQGCHPFFFSRLDHIVRRIHLISAQSKFLMPGHKDKENIPVKSPDPLCRLDPVHRLHLHIQKKELHLPGMLLKQVCGAHPVCKFIDDLFALPKERLQSQIQLFR